MVTEFLLNPIWQFVGVIASAVIAMTIYYLQRRVKRLAFGYTSIEADSNNPLLTRQFVIGLVSHGTEAIRQTDFERPLVIMFGENAKDLTYELLRVSPPYLKPNVSTTGNMLTLQPILLNHGDTIVLGVTGSSLSKPQCEARIAEITKELPVFSGTARTATLIVYMSFRIVATSIIIGLIDFLIHNAAFNVYHDLILGSASVAGIIFIARSYFVSVMTAGRHIPEITRVSSRTHRDDGTIPAEGSLADVTVFGLVAAFFVFAVLNGCRSLIDKFQMLAPLDVVVYVAGIIVMFSICTFSVFAVAHTGRKWIRSAWVRIASFLTEG
jgi:hypothetical protein